MSYNYFSFFGSFFMLDGLPIDFTAPELSGVFGLSPSEVTGFPSWSNYSWTGGSGNGSVAKLPSELIIGGVVCIKS